MRGEGGACMTKGGIHGEGGHTWGRGHVWYAPPQDMAGHCAGSTHPTGMHSCFTKDWKNEKDIAKSVLFSYFQHLMVCRPEITNSMQALT